MSRFQGHVFICTNRRDPGNPKGSCAAVSGEAVREEFKKLIADRGLRAKFRANGAGCLDQCEKGCSVVVYPEGVWYGHVQPADVAEIVDEHLVGGRPVTRLVVKYE